MIAVTKKYGATGHGRAPCSNHRMVSIAFAIALLSSGASTVPRCLPMKSTRHRNISVSQSYRSLMGLVGCSFQFGRTAT